MWRRFAYGVVMLLGWSSSVWAGDNAVEADRHFKRGVELAQLGELDEAVVEFEKAYASSPHFAVLYNLGKAHALAGRPVEAVATLREYLAKGGSAIDANRRKEVETVVRFNEQRIGTLELEVTPSSAAITIDGRTLSGDERRLVLPAGRHGLVASLAGHGVETVAVDVAGGQTKSLRIDLMPLRAASLAWLAIECPVPGVLVEVDGRSIGETPLQQLVPVAEGVRRVRFSRRWYVTNEATAVVGATPSTVRCDLHAVEPLPVGAGSPVRVADTAVSQAIWLDGAPYAGERVPTGRHRVELKHCGFEPWASDIEVGPSSTKTLAVSLEPTPELLRDTEERAARQRTWAYVTGGLGITLGAAAVALSVVSSQRFEAWQSDREALLRALSEGPPSHAERDEVVDLQEDATTIRRMDDVSIAFAVSAGLLVAVSATLFIATPDATPSSSSKSRTAMRVRSLEWRF